MKIDAHLAAPLVLPMLVTLFAAGCSSPSGAPPSSGASSRVVKLPPVSTATPQATTPTAPPAAPSPLEGEIRWMKQLFDGTPVAVETERDGAMRVEVPTSFSFDGDASVVKPPLAAVLDRIALSLKRHPTAKVQLAPPGSASAARVAAMKAHLRTRGVQPHRVAAAPSPRGEVVALRLLPGAQAIDRLEDPSAPAATLTPPSAH